MKSILNVLLHPPGAAGLRTAFVEALPVTLSLIAGAAVLSVGAGIWLALICVRHHGVRRPWILSPALALRPAVGLPR